MVFTIILFALAGFYAVLLGSAAAGFVLAGREGPGGGRVRVEHDETEGRGRARRDGSDRSRPEHEKRVRGGAPFVSILVPARNEENDIAACVGSILQNDYPADRFEVIVLDDASTDGTRDVVRSLQSGTNRVETTAGSAQTGGVAAPHDSGLAHDISERTQSRGAFDLDDTDRRPFSATDDLRLGKDRLAHGTPDPVPVRSTDRLRLVELEDTPGRSRAHKKRALAAGVDAARGQIIVTTDADCMVSPSWISTLVSYFRPDVGMVVGPVLYRRRGTPFDGVQALEYIGLVALGAGFVRLGIPHLCNSANLAYRRRAFEEIGGYEGLDRVSTGDDVFLLHRMGYESDWSVRACTERRAAVITDPNSSLRTFLAQRMRWTSGHARYEKFRHRLTSVLCYAFYAMLAIGFVLPAFREAALLALGIKVMSEASVLLPAAKRFGRLPLVLYLVPAQLAQIPYILFIGIAGTFGGYSWKGRNLAR